MANVRIIAPARDGGHGQGRFTRHSIELNTNPEKPSLLYAVVDQFPMPASDLVSLVLFRHEIDGEGFRDIEDNERLIRMSMTRDQARALAVALISFVDDDGRPT
jgi:hypothetical protein